MRIENLYRVCAVLLLILSSSIARAEEEFDPSSPPDPQASYRVVVTATPTGAAYTSGSGLYNKGAGVWIDTSVKDTDYRFVRWLKDGQEYTTSQGFYFTVGEENVTFTAEYEFVEFDPSSPDDPNLDYKWRLYLTAEPEEACSFNLNNGTQCAPESWVEIMAYINQGFVFQGWYDGGNLVSDAAAFNYEMPSYNAYLTARFVFLPDSPADPNSTLPEGSGITADVNKDGQVDAQDAVTTINAFLDNLEYNNLHDVNGDGKVDVQDATSIINYFLNSK